MLLEALEWHIWVSLPATWWKPTECGLFDGAQERACRTALFKNGLNFVTFPLRDAALHARGCPARAGIGPGIGRFPSKR